MVLGNINIHVQNPDFLFMVEYAIKAPSGHNTQPWLFRIIRYTQKTDAAVC